MTLKRGVLAEGMLGMKGYLYDKKKETDVGKGHGIVGKHKHKKRDSLRQLSTSTNMSLLTPTYEATTESGFNY
jgi:hypothetical protein